MKLAIISFEDVDVTRGLNAILDHYADKSPEVFFPVSPDEEDFSQSVLRVCIDRNVKVTAFFDNVFGVDHILNQASDTVITDDPVGELLRQLNTGDAIGIVWNDEIEEHHVVHSVEDLALDTWDITEGLDKIQIDDDFNDLGSDELHDALMKHLGMFVDLLAAFVASTVMESLSQAVAEHLANEIGKKDIFPKRDDE
jgi:hypothetical protein